MPIHPFFLKIRRKKAIVIVPICVLVLFIGLALYLCLPMPAGAAVDGYDLSSLPYWKALSAAQELYPQPIRVSLPEEELTFEPRQCGVKFDMGAAVGTARKTRSNVELRPFLKADEAAIRATLTSYAAKCDTTYREAEWHLTGTAPELATDRFDPTAEGQTLVVNVGVPEAHLDVEGVLNGILDAFARPVSMPDGCIAATIKPSKYPEMPDWEALAAEVYREPVDDAPDLETGGILPGCYGQSIDVSNMDTPGYGHVVAFPLLYTAPEVMGEDALYQDVLGECETKHNTNENRNTNLRLLCQALDDHIVQPGETFSYNAVVGERTKEKGYLPAPAYSSRGLVDSIGGGVCQGSTTLYNCVLLADLEVVFRACHGAKVTYVPPGLDAAVNYLTTDFQFRNQYRFPVKIQAEVSDGFVKMKLLGTDEKDYYVKMETTSGEDDMAVYARSYKCKYDKKTDELLSREIEAYSTYYKNIG